MLARGTMAPRLDRRRRTAGCEGLHGFALPQDADDISRGREITIRLANCDNQRNSANMLIDRRYSARGYGSGHRAPTEGTCVTFTASSRDTLVGTLSLTVDSPAGLAADRTFKDELDAIRRDQGVRICELTKFAFEASRTPLDLLASLFHTIFIYGTRQHGCTDLFIEVNPRHRRFYETMLGFEQAGPTKINHAVGAPSHLLRLRIADIRRRIDEATAGGHPASHSLYRFFFSRIEERGIHARLLDEGRADLHLPDWRALPARPDAYAFRNAA